jgi:hypothetical protein
MRRYRCRIYNFNYTHDPVKDRSEWSTTETLPVAETEAQGQDEREAAAEAYVLECGLERAYRMRQMGAPTVVIRFEIDVPGIAGELQQSDCWAGKCFYLDNRVEIVYIVTVPVE